MKINPNGHKWTDARGYVKVKVPNHPAANRRGQVSEHRLVMEHHIGRYLTGMEVVHHRDGNHANNAIENLVLCANAAEHGKLHRPPNSRFVSCCICGMKVRKNLRAIHQPQRCAICKNDGNVIRCKICGKPQVAKELCSYHYSLEKYSVPCASCGELVPPRTRPSKKPHICRTCFERKPKCQVCGKPQAARNLCMKHYNDWKRGLIKLPDSAVLFSSKQRPI